MTRPSRLTSIVVGGGIAGLVAARELVKKGDQVTLFEASGRLGGLISSVELLNESIDSGAEAFAVSRPQTLELISELGLSGLVDRPTRSDARIRIKGHTFLIPVGILGIPASLDDPDVKAAIGADALTIAKNLDSKPWEFEESPTIGELVERRLGHSVLEQLVAPVIGGVHASDPRKLEVRVVAPGLMEAAADAGSLVAGVAALRARASAPGSAVAGFRGGMHELVTRLATDLKERGVTVSLNSAVQSLAVTERGFEVSIKGQPKLKSDRLILAVPPHVAKDLSTSMTEVRTALGEINAVDVAVVVLAIESPTLSGQPLGSGVLVAEGDATVLAKASTHSTAKWSWLKERFGGDVEVIRLSYGRDGVLPVSEEDLIPTALKDATTLFGLRDSKLLDASVVIWRKSLIQPLPGHSAVLDRLTQAINDVRGLGVVGAGFGGNGITGIIAKTLETTSQIGVRYSHGE